MKAWSGNGEKMLKEKFGNKTKIIGIGSALIDILAFENDDFLNSISDIKGGMTLVENEFTEAALSKLSQKPTTVPGGAACNTIIGIGQLGGDAGFVGKCGDDELGIFFEKDLLSNNVSPMLFKSDTATGRVLSLITPDAQRSMFTCLGASAEMQASEVDEDCFTDAAIVVIEGYLLFNTDLMMAALKAARKAGALIAMDLASFTVVEESKDFLISDVMGYIDILIANEDEAQAFTGFTDEDQAIKALAENAEIAVLKVGERGSYISYKGNVTKIEPVKGGNAIDTTGAGDLWAAGFLHGIISGFGVDKSGQIASACGFEVCQVTGANIPEEGWDRIKKLL